MTVPDILKTIKSPKQQMKHTVDDGFPYYIELTEGKDYRRLFLSRENVDFLKTIGEEQAQYRYAPDKWSVKQIVGHITDHERMMTYRIFRFSRKDTTRLAGYDHDEFVANSRSEILPFDALLKDFQQLRAATNSLIQTLSPEQLKLKGAVGKFETTIENFLRATIGHELHHLNIIGERYFPFRD